jgi:hypothetical protein
MKNKTQVGCICTVPHELHGTCCGWDNANLIQFEGEKYLPSVVDAGEKEIRWLILQSPNKKSLIEWWVNRKQQFLILNSLAGTIKK